MRVKPTTQAAHGQSRLPRSLRSLRSIKPEFERLYRACENSAIAVDPIQIVHRYLDPKDQEIVGFLAAGLAFGRVTSVMSSLQTVTDILGPKPASFVRSFEPKRDSIGFRNFTYRWIRGVDLVALLLVLRRMLEQAGSIEGFFLEGYNDCSPDIGPSLNDFSQRALALDLRESYRCGDTSGVRYFFPRPSSGSGCKRLNLFLRWMVRRDSVDLGVWSVLPPSKLVIPLDIHIARVGQCLRLTKFRTPGWKMASEITASLRVLNSEDPVKYDFSLCHLGMSGCCGFNRDQRDERCPLRGICQPNVRRS